MTKKKVNRLKHQKDASFNDTSEEEYNSGIVQGKSCPHVARGIHFGQVKKSLKSTQSIVTCAGCSNDNIDLEELPEVWLCLRCGYRGCGRTSDNKHSLQHFKTLHSDCHSLVLSTTSSSVWCYDCDDEISLQSSHILKQCVEFVIKMAPNASNKPKISSVNKIAVNSLQNSVIKEENVAQNSETNGCIEKLKKPLKSSKEISAKISIKGLRNLGHTCFFNAVMQNLNQTSLLYHELKNTCNPAYSWEVPELTITNTEIIENENSSTIKLSLPRQLPLTNALLNFLEQMSAGSSVKFDIINPSPLFGEISKKCPQFRHFQQQDSHELLRQLLDGVRQEEIKRQKKAILGHFDLENVNPEEVDDEMKKEIKAYGCYASHTIIEKIFGGLLISTVLCEECKMSSQVFEPFMDLSLPLFEEKQQENNEQLNAMLDGGKQDHIKPLRSRKMDLDTDENASGEYILTKPKNDLGKPSKHQEKKQKQLAKKEKKRAKNTARNRKNSLNDLCDNSADNQLPEDDEKEVDEDEQDSKILEDNSVNNEEEESWELTALLEPDEDESHEISESVTQNLNSENMVESCHDAAENDSEKMEYVSEKPHLNKIEEVDLDGKATSDIQSPVSVQDVFIAENHIEDKINFDINNHVESSVKTSDFSPTPSCIELEDFVVKNSCEVPMSSNSVQSTDNQNHSETNNHSLNNGDSNAQISQMYDCNFLKCGDSNESTVKKSPNVIESQTDLSNVNSFSCLQNDELEEAEHLPDAQNVTVNEEIKVPVVISEQSNSSETVSQLDATENDVHVSKGNINCESLDDSVEGLVQGISTQLKISDSNQFNMDDRIQALSMQVKDVRIRRDSDRQENLLNSSESADDYESQKTNCTSPKSSIEDNCSIDNGDHWSHSVSEQQTKDWISKTLTTLKPRHHVSPLEYSINSCLSHFTKPELLTGNNKFRCENCTELKIKKTGNKKDVVYSNASKQLLIFSPPAVLTLHLKRFQQVGMSLRKVNRFVEFPLILDLAPFCCSASTILPHMSSVDDEILYSLYGIVEHSGRLTSGHYAAYVKANKRTVKKAFECHLPLSQCDLQQLLQKFSVTNKDSTSNTSEQISENRQWYYISDSHVKEVSETQVLKCQAYLLFYERIK